MTREIIEYRPRTGLSLLASALLAMFRSLPCVPAVALAAACATSGTPTKEIAGSYRFEAWSGERALRGTLTIQHGPDDWTGQLYFDATGPLTTLLFVFDGESIRITGEGEGRLVRVNASFSGSALDGSWSSGGRGGAFRARKTTWGGR